MKRNYLAILISLLFFSGCNYTGKSQKESISEVINESLSFSVKQSLLMAESLKDQPDLLPKTLNKKGQLETSTSNWWTSGFFPGLLWYLYEYSGNDTVRNWAVNFTQRVEGQKYNTSTHDVGFIIFCSCGNAYRMTGEKKYREDIRIASESLITRFNPKIGCIRSWNRASWSKQWQYPVIIDNMMNLEMLMWASREFHDNRFSNVAITHANTTLKNHFRKDFSSYHVVSYDTITGQVEIKQTSQGYSDESAWARGQSWALYGYTMMYRETKDTAYLKQAKGIAAFILNNPNLPDDKIPYWDFNAPDIPNALRDASAGAIICSALIELSRYVDKRLSNKYLSVAETQIRTLSSPEYRAVLGKNGNFILKHSVGNMPKHTEIDVPLSYADYYYVEALMRYKKLKKF